MNRQASTDETSFFMFEQSADQLLTEALYGCPQFLQTNIMRAL
jgi:hypothetical protein